MDFNNFDVILNFPYSKTRNHHEFIELQRNDYSHTSLLIYTDHNHYPYTFTDALLINKCKFSLFLFISGLLGDRNWSIVIARTNNSFSKWNEILQLFLSRIQKLEYKWLNSVYYNKFKCPLIKIIQQNMILNNSLWIFYSYFIHTTYSTAGHITWFPTIHTIKNRKQQACYCNTSQI